MGIAGHHVPVWYDESSGPASGQVMSWNAVAGRWEATDIDTAAIDTAGLATDAELTAGLATKLGYIPGVPENGTSDCQPAIQAYFDAAPVGYPRVGRLKASVIYGLLTPITLRNGQRLVFDSHGDSAVGCLRALAGWSGDALILSRSWTVGDWWHWAGVENVVLDGNDLAPSGIAIHQMGEECVLRRVRTRHTTGPGMLLTGQHAVGTLESCNAGQAGDYGVKLTVHPGAFAADGNGGQVRFFGLSGDANETAHIYFDGGQKLSIVGLKSEGHSIGIIAAGSASGGGAAQVFLTGSMNASGSGTDAIKIIGTAHPIFHVAALQVTGFTNWMNDTVRGRTVPTSAMSQMMNGLVWNGEFYLDPANFILGNSNSLRSRNAAGSVVSVLALMSNNETRINTGSNQGVNIQHEDPATLVGTAIARFKRDADGGSVISSKLVGSQGLTTSTKAGVPVDGDYTATPSDGLLAVNTLSGALHVRANGVHRRVAGNLTRLPDTRASQTFPRTHIAPLALTAGVLYVARMELQPSAYTTITFTLGSGGSALSNGYFGVYDITTLAKLAASADVAATFGGTGIQTVTLNYTPTTAGDYWVGLMIGAFTGTVTIGAAQLGASALAVLAPAIAHRHNTTSLTALPDPLVLQVSPAGIVLPYLRYE